jgi:hypothetical protein
MALGFDQCRGFEPIHGFDFGSEPVLALVRNQFNDGIGRVSMTARGQMDLGLKPGRAPESLFGGV